MRKTILLLVLAGVVLFSGAISASAQTPLTITFNDLTDTLSVSPSGSGSCEVSRIAESCTVNLVAPSAGYTFGSTTLPFLYQIGEGNAKLSDSLVYLPNPLIGTPTSVKLTFLSDTELVLPCLGGCNVIEDGTAQTIGTITWTKANSPDIVQTINFQSDVTPEPASLMLFGSGLVIAGAFFRRRSRLVAPSA
jgi:hypothetical protein